ncbi:MAG: hypothetical protein CM1200mP14_13550 [Gammaproteobacteria bacterium]|nr:MAG: hypothetical protein CM1200mP14_13550 [Gammaproteobacteria bacterium]
MYGLIQVQCHLPSGTIPSKIAKFDTHFPADLSQKDWIRLEVVLLAPSYLDFAREGHSIQERNRQ